MRKFFNNFNNHQKHKFQSKNNFEFLKFKLQSLLSPRPNTKKPYIFPTALGFSYGIFVIIFIIISVNNKNGLLFLFAFILFAFGFQAMLLTHTNIENIEIDILPLPIFFAQEPNAIHFKVFNNSSKTHYTLLFQLKHHLNEILSLSPSNLPKLDAIQPHTSQNLQIEITFKNPGIQSLPLLQMSSQFPFGFLQTWKKFSLTGPIQIFQPRINFLNLNTHSKNPKSLNDFIEFETIYKWQPGSEIKYVHWPMTLQQNKLYLKKFLHNNEQQPDIILEWSALSELSLDHKKSQLNYWIMYYYENHFLIKVCLPQKTLTINRNHLNEVYSALVQIDQVTDES